MLADATTTAEIMGVIHRYREAYARRDAAGVQAVCAPDADLVILGTGQDERAVGWQAAQAQFQRDWNQADTVEWEWGWHSVSSAGPVAWVLCETQMHARMGSIRVDAPTRLSAVLELRGDRWLIMHLHLSIPASGQDAGESFPPPLR